MINSTPTSQRQFGRTGSQAGAPDQALGADRDASAVGLSALLAELPSRPIQFEDLVERCMGNLDLATRLLDQSQSFLAEDLKMLQQCGPTDNAGEVTRLAHRLKGATANIGAYGLSEVFARIEQLAGTDGLSAVPVCLLEVETEWARFIECVADICSHK